MGDLLNMNILGMPAREGVNPHVAHKIVCIDPLRFGRFIGVADLPTALWNETVLLMHGTLSLGSESVNDDMGICIPSSGWQPTWVLQ